MEKLEMIPKCAQASVGYSVQLRAQKQKKDKIAILWLMRDKLMESTHFLDWKLSSEVASGNHGAVGCIQDVTQVAHTVC